MKTLYDCVYGTVNECGGGYSGGGGCGGSYPGYYDDIGGCGGGHPNIKYSGCGGGGCGGAGYDDDDNYRPQRRRGPQRKATVPNIKKAAIELLKYAGANINPQWITVRANECTTSSATVHIEAASFIQQQKIIRELSKADFMKATQMNINGEILDLLKSNASDFKFDFDVSFSYPIYSM